MNKKGVIGSLIGVLFFLSTCLLFSYASYTWKSDNTVVTFNFLDSYFYCESDLNVTMRNISPVLDYRAGPYQTFKVNNIGLKDTTFSLSLNIEEISNSLLTNSFKYKLVVDKTGGSNNCADLNSTGCEEVEGVSGDFSNLKVGMNTLGEVINLSNNSRYQYYLFLYIDGSMSNNVDMQDATLISTLGVCEIVAFLEYNGGKGDIEFLKVTSTYAGLPTPTRDTSIVNYNTNGGNSISSDSVTYSFEGWYLEKNFKTLITASSNVNLSTNHHLYAKWIPSKTITLPTPVRTGYTFAGWYNDSSFTKKIGDAGDSYSPSSSITLYAKWQAYKYDINYSYNGGSKGESAPTIANYDDVVMISNPTKTVTITGNVNGTGATVGSATSKAQTFSGWTSSTSVGLGVNAKTGTESNPNTAWNGSSTKNTYFRNLRDTSGTVTLTANWTAVAFNLPTISKTGYTCKWNTKADGSGTAYNSGASYTPSVTSATAITMYARCSIQSYNLTVVPNGGSYNSTTENTTVNRIYNDFYTLMTPTKTGYGLSNWTLSGSGRLLRGIGDGAATVVSGFKATTKTENGEIYTNYSSTTSATSNTWYYAKYPTYSITAGHTYEITFYLRTNQLTNASLDLRHACVSNDYSSTGRVAQNVTNVTNGWVKYTLTRTYASATIASSNGNNNVTIQPLFEIYTSNLANVTATIDFDIRDIVITDTTDNSYKYIKNYIYQFGAGAGTVTANWKANTYTVNYSCGSGSGTPPATQTATYDQSFTVAANTCSKTGYSFAGWSDPTGDTSWTNWTGTWKYVNGQYGIANNSLTLTAQWNITNHTVTYDYSTNGGSSATKTSATVNYGSAIDLTPTATKSGYTFVGWNMNKDATTALSSLTMGTSNVTLYAIFKKILTATFTVQDTSAVTSSATSTSCNAWNKATSCSITAPTLTSKTGYTSLGWNTNRTATTSSLASGGTVTISTNTTYYSITKYNTSLVGTFYYYNSGIKSTTASCIKYNGSSNCNITVPLSTFNTTTAQYGGTYVGYGAVNTMGTSTGSSIVLTSNTSYYVSYRRSVTEYYQGTSRTIYRNAFFTSTTAMNTVLSTSTTGTSNLSTESYTDSNSIAWNWYSYGTSSSTTTRTYTTVSAAASSTNTTLYTQYQRAVTAIFYYYSGSAQATTTASGTQMANYVGTVLSNGTITIPSAVSSSTGPNSLTYAGLSTSTGSTTTTTTITTAIVKYYAVYSGSFTATFAKGANVSAIGSSSLSCTSNGTTNGTTYSSTSCSITLPTITPTSGYIALGWYNSDGTKVGAAGSNLTLTSSATYTAKAQRLTANDFSYDNSKTGLDCDDVQCVIDRLDIIMADDFSYDNSKTGVDCNDIQCMIDKLDEVTQ